MSQQKCCGISEVINEILGLMGNDYGGMGLLDHIESIYENKKELMKKLKKASYKKNMEFFAENYGHYIAEMTAYIDQAQDKEQAAGEIAETFTTAVWNGFSKKGKINSGLQADLNLFTIYYVFPAILLTEHGEAKRIADAICVSWAKKFKNSNISYTTYDRLYETFHEKILGIF